MEAKSSCSGAAGEVRRIHIIYFLSHMSRIEHPHLIRVQHLTRNGVYLRDVKRWLAVLRGKEMTESYAWSYKRKYKTGYVWQDLVDDDLINPISDNEYVLKGSQITGSTYFENKVSKYKEKPGIKVDDDKELVKNNEEKVLLQKSYSFKEASQENQDSKIDTSIQSNISSEINEESTEFSSSNRSTLTDEFDSIKPIEQQQQQEQEQEQRNKFHNIISSSFKSKSPNRKSKSYSSGASNVFRNLISCKGVDTNDAVLVMSNRVQYKDKAAANNQPNGRLKDYVDGQISKGESLGGSARVIGSCWNMQQQQQIENNRRSVDGRLNWKKHQHSDFTEQKAVFAAYKPVGEPKCSQCGKPFKPEKMQSHMKSCRGIKALAKTTSVERTAITPSCKNSSVSAYFITN